MKKMSPELMNMVANRFKIMAEVTRLRILYTLQEGELNVQEIVDRTGANQANVSKHLAMMLEIGILKKRKEGLNSFYSIADKSIFQLCQTVCGSIEKNLQKTLENIKEVE
ncbi:metalloregulator ArsR/SmtB family transcription factor [bacterium]|nr:metalloregulator ArsR/SmtB family transcription factor [bacterium]